MIHHLCPHILQINLQIIKISIFTFVESISFCRFLLKENKKSLPCNQELRMSEIRSSLHSNCCPLCKDKIMKLEQLVNLLYCYMSDYLPSANPPAIVRTVENYQKTVDQESNKTDDKKQSRENQRQKRQCINRVDELVKSGKNLTSACALAAISLEEYRSWKEVNQKQPENSDNH